MRLVTDSINKGYCASGWFVRMENNSCGGKQGGGSPEEMLREAGVFREREAGDHIDRRLKKNIINNNFNIIIVV